MKKWIERGVKWVWGLIKEEIVEKFDEISTRLDALEKNVHEKHAHDDEAKECDLASLDDQICSQIEKCRLRGYTTESDRRRVTRMHEAYRARGGNHGEEHEYELFLHLKTEEEYFRPMKGE